MTWRLAKIECCNCHKRIGWKWGDWSDALDDLPTSDICDTCLKILYPKHAEKVLKDLKGANDHGESEV
jgi:hypothetical protein